MELENICFNSRNIAGYLSYNKAALTISHLKKDGPGLRDNCPPLEASSHHREQKIEEAKFSQHQACQL